MRFLIYSFFFLLTTGLAAQEGQKKPRLKKSEKLEVSKREDWNEGTVILQDGTELKGQVRYNPETADMSFTDGEEIKILTPKRALHITFFDAQKNRERVFYSIEYSPDVELKNATADLVLGKESELKISKKSEKEFQYFELLKAYKSFAFVLRTAPIIVTPGTSPTAGNVNSPNSVPSGGSPGHYDQLETIYILDDAGNIEPYVSFHHSTKRESKKYTLADENEKGHFKNEKLLSAYVSEAIYVKLEAFAKENGLRFRIKNDLLAILAYYDTLIAKP